MSHALIVSPDEAARAGLLALVEGRGLTTATAHTLREARRALKQRRADVVFAEAVLEDGSALDLLPHLPGSHLPRVIITSDDGAVVRLVESVRARCVQCLVRPFDPDQVKDVLTQALEISEKRHARRERKEAQGFGLMLGNSKPMREVYNMIAKVAPTDVSVMIYGESGTGKELVAQSIHERSDRRDKPFVAINCGAIPENLIESELFGHEKGAFTGADRSHQGVFERADGGSLLLDEITEMPLKLQVKLLRVLETGRVCRVGGDRDLFTDVRVIAATNRDPAEAAAEGDLREDLMYRLAVFPMSLPPLRDREDDAVLLARYFLSIFNEEEGVEKRLSAKAIERIGAYPWPGNVRQLRNVIHQAFILEGDELELEALDKQRQPSAANPLVAPVNRQGVEIAVGTSISEAERRLIHQTLAYHDGDKRQAARVLGISLKTLYNRLNEYAQQEKMTR